ncbi:hypothetical protein [Agromyces binzhouensis]|uniref:Uncharacterized protein n=1 Tax=Agromyces binzhouensis TaxID=1817495 RepID=A0A4Q2JU21_9MICO|nr:hypothetical protein [Agromyces binzhouensis]RXZ51921.1 hypothetical protein ESO86_00260 [Agromyces binzhouensis]
MSATESAATIAPQLPPPSTHQLALMIWVAVFPTLTALNLLLGPVLDGMPSVVRTLILATIAVPIVIYGIMPWLHRGRRAIIARIARRSGLRTQ